MKLKPLMKPIDVNTVQQQDTRPTIVIGTLPTIELERAMQKEKEKLQKEKEGVKEKENQEKVKKGDELTETFQPITSQKKHTTQQNNGIQVKRGKALTISKMNPQYLIGKITVLLFLRNPRTINSIQRKTNNYLCLWIEKKRT